MAPKRRQSLEALLAEYRKAGKSPAETAALASILSARAEAGLSQQQVAEKMGTTQSAIARLEGNLARGKYPSLRTLQKYAIALDKRVELRFI